MMSFRDYHSKIKTLSVSDEQNLNLIIDQINALDIVLITEESEIAGDLLCDLAKLVISKDDHILSKFCSLLNFLLSKQKISLTPSSLDYLIKFISSKLNSCGTWILSDVLIAFSALLNNGCHLKLEKLNDLFSENSILLSSIQEDKSIQYNVLQSLFALLKNLGENALPNGKLDLISQKCLIVLKNNNAHNIADLLSLKILVSCLKILQLVFSSKNATIKNISEILGTLKSLSFYGLPGQSFTPSSTLNPTLPSPDASHLQESQSESDASYPKLRKQKKNRRKVKKIHKKQVGTQSNHKEFTENLNNKESYPCDTSNCGRLPSSSSFKDIKMKNSSSDSEFSDVESQTSKTKALQTSIRQNAYQTLQAVVKLVDQKIMFGYWSSFLPDHPFMPGMPSSQTIFTTILKDSSSQVRLSALTLLIEMLKGSKQYLALADGRSTRHTAFTSLSSILAAMISEIHRCLLLTLLSENSSILLIQILKCYVVLSENVPYAKISKDILFKFLKHIKGFVYHKDIQIQVACLSAFTAIINSCQTPDELQDLMLSSDFDYAVDIFIPNSSLKPDPSLSDDKLPWIVEVCQRNIFNEDHLSLKIQSLQLLSSLTAKYFNKTECFFPVIKETVLFCINDLDSTLQLHGVKLLDIIGRCINNMPKLDKHLSESVSDLFLKVVTGPLIKCLSNEEHKTLQAAVCDCLSTLQSADFAILQPKQQILYVSILVGLASDSNPNVRGAAIRCLGIYCLFPCLIQDVQFFDDLRVILVKSVNDPNVNVRFKASWALGNFSDALFSSRDNFLSDEEMSIQFFYSTGKSCIDFSKDCDRVKANAVRSLGNFLHYVPEHYLDLSTVQDFVRDACDALLSALSANSMKVCWNACYALSSMMKNDVLMKKGIINLECVLNSLIAVLKSPNFKVRISSAQAISCLTSRTQYGTVFPVLWKQLLASLQSSFDDVNFKEIKHQETLCDQLCHSLCQLASIITAEDLPEIEKATFQARETLLTSMWKFGSHSTAEKNTNVQIAVERIVSLKKDANIKDGDSTLMTLEDILNQAILAYFQENSCNNF